MITHLHNSLTPAVSISDSPHDAAISAGANDNVIIDQPKQSGRGLRNFLLVGNAVAWIVIILVARALLF